MIDLRLGDCLDVLPGLADNSVDAIVTDPPYKLSQTYSANTDPDNLIAVSSLWMSSREMFRVARPGAVCVLFYDTRILPLALRVMSDAGWKYMRALTLYRRWGQASLMSGWMSTSDFALVFYKPGEKPKFHGPYKHDVYVKAGPEDVSFDHPAQKPSEFVRQIVENITMAGETVLDPYCGSGTTAEACVRLGRRFIGIEREQTYFETAQCRIADAQAQLALPV